MRVACKLLLTLAAAAAGCIPALALQPDRLLGELHGTPASSGSPILPADRGWVHAIEQNDAARLGLLFPQRQAAGLSTTVRNQKGKTALMAAAAAGNVAVFKQLVSGGADPAATNIKGASTLMYAAWRGNPEIISRLLAHQVSLDQAASNGWTAMTMAAAKGHVEAIRLLVNAGAKVDSRDVYAWTPLMRASDLGRVEVARLLARPGVANLRLINTSGQTALHLAAAGGHQEVYELLSRAGADSRQPDFRGRTPEQITAARN